MLSQVTDFIFGFENILWAYFGVPAVLFLGIVLTYQSRFAQFRNLPLATKTFLSLFKKSDDHKKGIPPLRAFFASIGGSVGVGNVVGVCTAVQIGGPGALFWIWVTAMAGAIVKYSEVYLGMKYRQTNANGEYCGGPMYFLRQAVDKKWVATAVSVLLCLYGVEVFQFSVVTNSIASNLDINIAYVVGIFLAMIIFAGLGGIRRVGAISTALIPVFVFMYVGMGSWILFHNIDQWPTVFSSIISSAFTGHAALGGLCRQHVDCYDFTWSPSWMLYR